MVPVSLRPALAPTKLIGMHANAHVTRHADGFLDRGSQVTRLEAFVDAAFAFAVTMLVISIDQIPRDRGELTEALKGIS